MLLALNLERMKKTVNQVIAILEENGWSYTRTKGDHHIFTKPGAKRPITVVGKGSDDVWPNALNSILREAGLK